MTVATKRQVLFALLMGAVTGAAVTFVGVASRVGFVPDFLWLWGRAFFFAYIVIVPFVLFVAPRIQRFVNTILPDKG